MLYNRATKECVMPKDEYIEIAGLPFKMTKAMMTETAFYGQREASFHEASDMIRYAKGLEINRETVRQVSEYVGKKVHEADTVKANEAYKQVGDMEKTDSRGGTLYILTDGAMVNTVEAENGSTWRENKLLMVFSDKYVMEQKNRNNVILKKEYAAYVGSVDEFKKHVYRVALENEYRAYENVVVIGDGATWIRTMCSELFPHAQQILDKYHLCEHIYDYAKSAFHNSPDKYTPWAKTVIEKIEEGKVSEALVMIEESVGNGDEAKKLTGYIQNNADKINYKYYEEQGWFVGSGAIESSNKVVLQRRLKQSGMRWSVDGAQYIVTLRAKSESRLWERDVVNLICA